MKCVSPLDLSVQSITKSAVFLLLLPRAWSVARRSDVKVRPSSMGTAKLALCFTLVAVTLANLVAQVVRRPHDVLDASARALSVLAAIGVGFLSTVSHKRSVKASNLVLMYLVITAGRELYSLHGIVSSDHALVDWLTPATGAVRLVLLFLECASKESIFLPEYKGLAPVETANVFSALTFWWVNKLLVKGNKRILQIEDMPPLDSQLKPDGLNQSIKNAWRTRNTPETGMTLFKVLFKTHKWPIFATTMPRLFLVLFECSQPILIKTVILYVESPNRERACHEYSLVFSAVVIYIGLSISRIQYLYQSARLQLSVQSSLTSLVYDKTLSTAAHAADTGKATTVMSTDVEAIGDAPDLFLDGIGQALELFFGLLILGDQVKWLWPVPLVIIFLCSRVSKFVAKNIRSRQRNWNEATERRIGALSSMLGSMKSVKSLGITETLVSHIAGLRKDELAKAGEKRFMDCQYNASANALGIFAPALTVVLFAIVSHIRAVPLDTAAIFTTVAALAIVTHPANMMMTIYPKIVAVNASFERLQEFLLSSPLEDTRKTEDDEPSATADSAIAVSCTNVSIKGSNNQPILSDIDLKLPYGSITACCGAVGSGKSVLGKTIIGEMPAANGVVRVASKKIGFCDQAPWLMAGTIKEVICAFATSIDEVKYRAVVKACCLDHDLNQLQEGDELVIGSRGVNLSGGQKQRIALARMLYADESIFVLDDSFAALDGTTETQVVENLLGPDGLLRKKGAAVLWITNSAQYFHLADNIIFLEQGKIRQQGTATDMGQYVNELKKFNFGKEESVAEPAPVRTAKDQGRRDAENDLYRQTGDFSLYGFYLKSTGILAPIAVVGTISLFAIFSTLPTYWVKYWAESNDSSIIIFAAGYLFMAFMAWAGTSFHMWTVLFLLAQRSGTHLHHALTLKIFGAPLSYFVGTDIGVTLNRFSQDINLVDRQLPNSFSRFVTQCCKITVQITVLCLVQNQFAVVVPVCAIVVYFVQKVYLRTSRQLRVLDLEAKATLYSGFHETIDGLPTIRAFGWQHAVEQRNINAIDLYMRPLFMLRSLARWLFLVLEFIVRAIAIGIVASAVIGGNGRGTNIGVALNLVILTNATLVSLVTGFTNLEISLGAIARLKNVAEFTPQEDLPQETIMPESHWPARGELALKDLATGYKINHNVVESVNLVANAGQKLVVCGRTGSGKSTIFMSLLRLIESTGSMEVDGTDILKVPRSVVRSRCFIAVPQDGTVFKDATLRFNLDPTATVSDDKLKAALNSTSLWTALSSTEDDTGDILDKKFSSLPPLSAGQQQLFALSRAVTQKYRNSTAQPYSDDEDGYPHNAKPIVLLDELTAFMDSATETKVYDVVEKEFVSEGHTVIIVSHRLGGLLGRLREGVDAVAVLKDGRLSVEKDFSKLTNVESSDEQSDE